MEEITGQVRPLQMQTPYHYQLSLPRSQAPIATQQSCSLATPHMIATSQKSNRPVSVHGFDELVIETARVL
jgi:hypothetical protein